MGKRSICNGYPHLIIELDSACWCFRRESVGGEVTSRCNGEKFTSFASTPIVRQPHCIKKLNLQLNSKRLKTQLESRVHHDNSPPYLPHNPHIIRREHDSFRGGILKSRTTNRVLNFNHERSTQYTVEVGDSPLATSTPHYPRYPDSFLSNFSHTSKGNQSYYIPSEFSKAEFHMAPKNSLFQKPQKPSDSTINVINEHLYGYHSFIKNSDLYHNQVFDPSFNYSSYPYNAVLSNYCSILPENVFNELRGVSPVPSLNVYYPTFCDAYSLTSTCPVGSLARFPDNARLYGEAFNSAVNEFVYQNPLYQIYNGEEDEYLSNLLFPSHVDSLNSPIVSQRKYSAHSTCNNIGDKECSNLVNFSHNPWDYSNVNLPSNSSVISSVCQLPEESSNTFYEDCLERNSHSLNNLYPVPYHHYSDISRDGYSHSLRGLNNYFQFFGDSRRDPYDEELIKTYRSRYDIPSSYSLLSEDRYGGKNFSFLNREFKYVRYFYIKDDARFVCIVYTLIHLFFRFEQVCNISNSS